MLRCRTKPGTLIARTIRHTAPLRSQGNRATLARVFQPIYDASRRHVACCRRSLPPRHPRKPFQGKASRPDVIYVESTVLMSSCYSMLFVQNSRNRPQQCKASKGSKTCYLPKGGCAEAPDGEQHHRKHHRPEWPKHQGRVLLYVAFGHCGRFVSR